MGNTQGFLDAIQRARLVVLCFSFCAAAASGATYYVTTGGNNSNSGTTEGSAWRTITYAATKVNPGDIVNIKAGNYGHEHVVINRSGTSGSYITFKGYGGEVKIDGQDKTGEGILISGASYVKIEGITATRYLYGIKLNNDAHHCTIKRCKAYDNEDSNIAFWHANNCQVDSCQLYNTVTADAGYADYGIYTGYCDDCTFSNCTIMTSGTAAGLHHGIAIRRYSHRNRVMNCLAYGTTHSKMCEYFGAYDLDNSDNQFINCQIIMSAYTGKSDRGFHIHGKNNKVINCTATGVTIGIYLGYSAYDSNPVEGAVFRNNIIANTKTGFYKSMAANGTVIEYNDIWNATTRYSGITPGAGDMNANPLFASSSDLHLQSKYGRWNGSGWVTDANQSPCIDAGDPSSSYANEPAPNGNRINMGAYGNTIYASKSPGGTGNTPPTAYIDAISPSPATVGQSISFNGHGTDDDGTVTGFEWSSSINGVFGTTEDCSYAGLSAGTHTISYRVKDNNGAWSAAVTRTLSVNGGGGGNIYIEDFSDGVANGFSVQAGSWAVTSGSYKQSSTSETNSNSWVAVSQSGRLTYQWKVAYTTNASAGMHIYCSNGALANRGNSYLIFQTPDYLQIYESVNDVLTKMAQATCSNAAGQTHTYKAIYDPATGVVQAYRDGGTSPIVSWTDSSPLFSGAAISLRTNGTVASFDDISVASGGSGSSYILDCYVNDSYTGATSSYCFKQVLIDGQVVWEEDVAGAEGGWLHAQADITNNIAGKSQFSLALRLHHKKAVSDFPVDVYWDAVSINGLSIANPGMENTSGWTYGENLSAFSGAYSTAFEYDGSYSYKISFPGDTPSTAGSYGQISQTITVNKGGSPANQTSTETPRGAPSGIALQLSPNLFLSTAEIRYQVSTHGRTMLAIYNINGQLVCRLVDGELAPGRYAIKWDGSDRYGKKVTSGVYLCRLEAGDDGLCGKLILLR